MWVCGNTYRGGGVEVGKKRGENTANVVYSGMVGVDGPICEGDRTATLPVCRIEIGCLGKVQVRTTETSETAWSAGISLRSVGRKGPDCLIGLSRYGRTLCGLPHAASQRRRASPATSAAGSR